MIIGERSVDWVIPIAARAYAIAAGRINHEHAPIHAHSSLPVSNSSTKVAAAPPSVAANSID